MGKRTCTAGCSSASAGAAHEPARELVGAVAVVDGLGAGDERGAVALGALHEPPRAAGQVEALLGAQQPQGVEVDEVEVGPLAGLDGAAVARTALGVIAEAERYDLTVTATGFEGEPIEAYGVLYDHGTQNYGLIGVAGETTLRLPAGTYSLISVLELSREPDTVAQVIVGDPDLVLDGAASVAFDARAAKPVTVDVGEKGLEALVRRMNLTADDYEQGVLAPVWTDELWAQPMTAPNAIATTDTISR